MLIQNLFLVLAIAFATHLLLFFFRGNNGDDIMAVVTGAVFTLYTTFKILVFKRDNPGKPITVNWLCGFDALQERAARTQRKVEKAAAAAAEEQKKKEK